ncbi:MAG: hypothetical protein LBG59_02055 [Candidatus Peribacteria bacterium]|nr:hypothetical protein [Candidatus Peribacteria bacterium]
MKKDTQDTRNRMLRELPTGGEALKQYKAEEQYESELKRLEEKRSQLQNMKEQYYSLKGKIEAYRTEKEREEQREDQINRENIEKVINDTFDNFIK